MAMVTTDYQKIKKITQGRRKIEIKKLENKSTKHVTFSKRRAGLFKKAGELCVLCGVDIAIIAYSPGEKAYSFGHPNVDTVLNSYLAGNTTLPASSAVNPWPVEEFNKEYAESLKELEDEKKRLEDIGQQNLTSKKNIMRNDIEFLWDEPIDEMGIEELEQYLAAMKEMRIKTMDQFLRMQNSINNMKISDYNHRLLGYHEELKDYQNGNYLSGSGTGGEDVGSTSAGTGFGLGINNYQFGSLIHGGDIGGDFGNLILGGDFGASSTTGFGLGSYDQYFCSNPSTAGSSGCIGDDDDHVGTSAGYGFGVQ